MSIDVYGLGTISPGRQHVAHRGAFRTRFALGDARERMNHESR
jgi:hypothetical protein